MQRSCGLKPDRKCIWNDIMTDEEKIGLKIHATFLTIYFLLFFQNFLSFRNYLMKQFEKQIN